MAISEEEKLRNLMTHRMLEPLISHIRFPQYKNLEANTRIDFTYPITALVGANGTNKSSILRALYGAPENHNLGNFWFSTAIDPIEETGEKPSCFIYGYWNSGHNKLVEVIKTRVNKEDDPDYWEPSRPIISYNMEPPEKILPPLPIPEGRSKTRWNTIKKNVVYLDFRAALSAYDKFFYHGELRSKPNTEKNKKDFIRVRAPSLKRALDDGLKSCMYRRSERIVDSDNRILDANEVNKISAILGRKYEEIKLIRHTFFNCDAYTCLMRVAGLKYTEAFAGSGEFAVVRIVTSVLGANPSSLILLDEPEVSLHPGAQDRLIEFLTESVKLQKHQIVISTHSPSIVRKLPQDAIKVLLMDDVSGKVKLPKQSALAEEAFFHLGETISDKITVLVEDILAAAIVKRALLPSGEAIANMFEIRFFPGGSETLWAYYLPTYAAEGRSKMIVLFDGDKRPESPMCDPQTISEVDEGKLKDEVFRVTGADIVFHSDGGKTGGNIEQQTKMRRDFITWANAHVDYLPGTHNPEAFVWANMKHDSNSSSISDSDAKKCFTKLTKIELGVPDYEVVKSSEILDTQRRKLATIPENHVDLAAINKRLLDFASQAGIKIA